MTTQASLWTTLAASGPGLPRTLFLDPLGQSRLHSTGGTWTLSTPNGCRRGTAELMDLPPAQGRYP